MGNKNPIPEKEMKEHLLRGKEMIALISSTESMKEASSEKESVGKFFTALLDEYSAILANDKFEESGISLEANSVIYGYDAMPVLRISIADKEKLMALIQRAEKESSYKVEFTKCGEFDCFESTDPNGEMAVTAVFLNDHLAVSVFAADKKESIKKHLIGEAKPKTPYSEEDWDKFLKENSYPGYGDGFISLQGVFDFAKPMITEQLKGLGEKTVNGCLNVAQDHIQNIPEIVFGTKEFKGSTIDYELLFRTSDVVSSALQTIANDTNISHRTSDAVLDFGININFPKLRDALTQYSGFLIKSGEEHECPMIDAQEIRKSMGGMAMVMNMGLSQFSSVYASVSGVELDDNMQPKKIDAVISLGSNDPAGLIAMAGSMVPPLSALKIPEDGSVVKLPDGLLPTGGVKSPEVFIGKNEKAINIFIGNDKPALTEHKNDIMEVSFSSMDFKGYLDILTEVLSKLPEPQTEEMPDIEMLKKIGEGSGKMTTTTSADKRGLVINHQIEY